MLSFNSESLAASLPNQLGRTYGTPASAAARTILLMVSLGAATAMVMIKACCPRSAFTSAVLSSPL